jgi:hypothetical protein
MTVHQSNTHPRLQSCRRRNKAQQEDVCFVPCCRGCCSLPCLPFYQRYSRTDANSTYVRAIMVEGGGGGGGSCLIESLGGDGGSRKQNVRKISACATDKPPLHCMMAEEVRDICFPNFGSGLRVRNIPGESAARDYIISNISRQCRGVAAADPVSPCLLLLYSSSTCMALTPLLQCAT